MKFLWCDIETTGLEVENHAPFQVAFIFVYSDKKGFHEEAERIYYLNPFDIAGIVQDPEAEKVHGYKESVIRTFEDSNSVVIKINQFLQDMVKFQVNGEKMFFCGYNSNFDFNHLVKLFERYNLDFSKYFIQQLDVFQQVKNAGAAKVLPYLENRKLVTIAKYLNVDLTNAHDAMGDIKATREVAKSLAKMGIPLK